MNTTNEFPKAFHIYGKMDSMKKFKPINRTRFVTNLIHADIYQVHSEQDRERLQKELAFLNTQGSFELREIKNFFN